MRGLRSTLLLGAVLLALAAYIGLVDSRLPVDEAGPAAIEVTSGDITEITVTASDGVTSRLVRENEVWRLIDPVEAAADIAVASTIAGSLASIEVQRELADEPTSLQEYGLDPPRVEVAFRTANGEEYTVRIGATTPAGDNRYARIDDGGIILVGAFLDDTFNRVPFDLRDKRLLVFNAAGTDALAIEGSGAARRFARREGAWTIEAPFAARGDHAAIDAVVSSLSSGRMQAVVEENPDDLAVYGLDPPALTATVTIEDEPATLLLGAVAGDERIYAKDSARPAVFTVPAGLLEDLETPLDELRTVDVFDFRALTAERVDIVRDGESLVLERAATDAGESVWRAGETVLDAEVADAALTALVNLRVGAFLDERHAALETPAMTVTATFDGGRTETVVFAREGDDVFAGRADEPGSARLELTTRYEAVLDALDATNQS